METKKKLTKEINRLTKEQESELSWEWHLNPSLALVYKNFENFVAVRTNQGEKCF